MITVIGSLNMDLTIQAERIPRPGETVMGSSFEQHPGGKGANQADAVAKLGAPVTLIGAVGRDEFGETLIRSLHHDGVITDAIIKKENTSTGIAAIIVEKSGNNAITVSPGANFLLEEKDLVQQEHLIGGSNILLLQLETKMGTVKVGLRLAKDHGVKTILNPAPAAELDDELLGMVDLLTPNETELEQLTGMETETVEQVQLAAEKLIKRGVKEVIVTLGEKGCFQINKETSHYFKANPVKPVDTTAAGDSFNGALAVALCEGESMENAIQFAMAVGALTVTKKGAQSSLPYRNEVDDFMKGVSVR